MIVFRVTRSQGVPNGLHFDNKPVVLGIVGGVMGRMRGSAVAATDERVGLMTEIISNIRTIKLNCLEYHFRKRISAARRSQ